jgi:hypothetical protein
LSIGQTVNALYRLLGQVEEACSTMPQALVLSAAGAEIGQLLFCDGRLMDVHVDVDPRPLAEILSRAPALASRDPQQIAEVVRVVTRRAMGRGQNSGEELLKSNMMTREALRPLWPHCLAVKLLALLEHCPGLELAAELHSSSVPAGQLSVPPSEVLMAAASWLDRLPIDEAHELFHESHQSDLPAVLLMQTDTTTRLPIPLAVRGLGRSLKMHELSRLARLAQQAARLGHGVSSVKLLGIGCGRWATRCGEYRTAFVRIGNATGAETLRHAETELLADDAALLLERAR